MVPDIEPTASRHSRRTVLRTGAGALSAAVLGGLAGCLGEEPGDGQDDGDGRSAVTAYDVTDNLDLVPSGVQQVQYTHVADLLADDAFQTLADAFFQRQSAYEYYDGPTTFSEAKAQFDENAPVTLSGLREAVQYGLPGKEDELPAQATILWTDWSEADVRAGFETLQNDAVTETTYQDTTVYQPDTEHQDERTYAPSYRLASFGDGVYAWGARRAVTSSIDADAGLVDGFSGPFRDDIEAVSGPVRIGMDVPQERLEKQAESDRGGGSQPLDPAVMAQVSRVIGSVFAEEEARTAELTFVAESSEVATDIGDVIEPAITNVSENIDDVQAIADLVDDVGVTVDGRRVTVAATATIEEIDSLADDVASHTPESHSEATGSDSETATKPQLAVEDARGTVADGAVESIALTVALGDGADPVNLTEAKLYVDVPGRNEGGHLDHAGSEDSDAAGTFLAEPDRLVSAGETATLTIDLGADDGLGVTPVGQAAEPGANVLVAVMPPDGRHVAHTLEVPSKLSGDSVVLESPRP